MMVSSQWHPSLQYLHAPLVESHGSLISTVFNKAIAPVESIHALLIMIMWPIPRGSLKDDPSWMYSGLLLNAGMQIGLHRAALVGEDPEPDYDERVEASSVTKTLTWLSCFNNNVM